MPIFLKCATIIMMPNAKMPNPVCMNDYRPVALTPIVMKCFAWLVMNYIRSLWTPTVRIGISTLLHLTLTHLKNKELMPESCYLTSARHLTQFCHNSLLKTVAAGHGSWHLLLDTGLPDGETADGLSWQRYIQNHHSDHRVTIRVCTQPFTVYVADT